MLPPACHWIHFDHSSGLYYNYRCVAVARNDGTVILQGWGVDRVVKPYGSKAMAVRHIERWVAARRTWPGSVVRRRRQARHLSKRLAKLTVALVLGAEGGTFAHNTPAYAHIR